MPVVLCPQEVTSRAITVSSPAIFLACSIKDNNNELMAAPHSIPSFTSSLNTLGKQGMQHMTPSDSVSATKHPLTGPLNFTHVERVDEEDKRPKGWARIMILVQNSLSTKLKEYFQYNNIWYYIFAQYKFYFIALLHYMQGTVYSYC